MRELTGVAVGAVVARAAAVARLPHLLLGGHQPWPRHRPVGRNRE